MKDFNIKNYTVNNNPEHHIDIYFKDEGQKEVYLFCKDFMKDNNLLNVIDVGCGSAYKLVTFLNEFNTIGIETEPCYSYLKQTYPNFKWLLSGEQEKSFKSYDELNNADVVICSDVIEHIVNPDNLIEYLLSLNSKYYIISTPCREILCNNQKFSDNYKKSWNGPPINNCHVREWTMEEFKEYISEKFTIMSSYYCQNQIECQYHLLKVKY
uniref:Methyltransferase type 11 domain-containing protein n=1 Tax=viral metagenome TaxID=1070528 RepID=A0A6C0J066_9ZZZZ